MSEDDGSLTAKAIENVEDVLDWRSETDTPHTSLSRQQLRQHKSSKSMASAVSFYAKVPPSSSTLNQEREVESGVAIHAALYKICHYSADYRMASHDMSTIVSKLKSAPFTSEQLKLFNTNNLSHVFMDDQVKIDSSYGHMTQLWDCGVPCISLCHHLPSLATKLHHGKFRANGSCGFVPKPVALRGERAVVDEEEEKEDAYVLLVHVISGQELPDSVPNIPSEDLDKVNEAQQNDPQTPEKTRAKHGFSVVLNLHDAMPVDNVEQKTRSIVSHGRNPFWNEVFSFAVKDMNQGQLTLRVFYDDYCEGFSSIPLGCLRKGYRTVALFNEDEHEHFIVKKLDCASLFVRVSVCPASSFKNVKRMTRSASDTHTSPMKVIKQGQSFRRASMDGSMKELPVECGVIEGIPPLNPVRGKMQFQPTPLAVKSAVALRHQPSKEDVTETPNSMWSMQSKGGTDYRKFNLYGQHSMDGIQTPHGEELDSLEVVRQSSSVSQSSTSNQDGNPVTPPSRLGSRVSSKNPIENLRLEGMRRAGSSSRLSGTSSPPRSPNTNRRGMMANNNSPSFKSTGTNISKQSSDDYSYNIHGLESMRQFGGHRNSGDTFGSSGDFDDDVIDTKFSISRDYSGGDEKQDEMDDERSSRFSLNIKPSSSGSINDHSTRMDVTNGGGDLGGPRIIASSSQSVDSHDQDVDSHRHHHSHHRHHRHHHRSSSRDHDHHPRRAHSRSSSRDHDHHHHDEDDMSHHSHHSRHFHDENSPSSRGGDPSSDKAGATSSRNAVLSPVGEGKSEREEADDLVSLHSFGSDDPSHGLKGKHPAASASFRDREKERARRQKLREEEAAEENGETGLRKKSSAAELSSSHHSHHSSHHSRSGHHGHHSSSSHSLHGHGHHSSSHHSLHGHGHGHHSSSHHSHHHHRSSSGHHGSSRSTHRQKSRGAKDDHSVDLKELGEHDQERRREKEHEDKRRGRGQLSRRTSSRGSRDREGSSSRDREGASRERGLGRRESSRKRLADRKASSEEWDTREGPSTEPWDVGI